MSVEQHSPTHDTDVSVLEELDFPPPCTYSQHHRVGTGPARWFITYRNPLTHGCVISDGPTRTVTLCDGCWQYRWRPTAGDRCIFCGLLFDLRADIISMGPL